VRAAWAALRMLTAAFASVAVLVAGVRYLGSGQAEQTVRQVTDTVSDTVSDAVAR
jgi:hypothetical protein